MTLPKWEFWIDRGGTFTDVVARSPDGELQTRKFLSENPESYDDAALHGIRQILGLDECESISLDQILAIKMGTTVATNALLERKGEATLLAITRGMGDVIEIGYQARPKTFALNIEKPDLLYQRVVEVKERITAEGAVETPLDVEKARADFEEAFNQGLRSIAIVLMHGYKFPQHEQALEQIAREIGFTQISVSHEVSPLSKIVARGDTTIVDAYLTPILRNYIDRISGAFAEEQKPGQILFMQSSGGLADAGKFRGRDAILSGPAGGIVGCVHTAKLAGFDKVIGFDMGGTSTDVTHYAGEFEKLYETEIAGVRMRVPMLHIHTVAAGGGSILKFEDGRFRVGPESAGADPGPVCYRRGGPLAVTDINLCVGKLQPEFFPRIFGPQQDQPLDAEAVRAEFSRIAQEMGAGHSAESVAEGFLAVAVEHMAQAIKKISVSRGYDVKQYALNCFGGAGGQHACLVADRLGISKILLHPFAGVLSAYGIGLARIHTERQKAVGAILDEGLLAQVGSTISALEARNAEDLGGQGVAANDITHNATAMLRYRGTETVIGVELSDPATMIADFEEGHKRQFGFLAPEKDVLLDMLAVESEGGASVQPEVEIELADGPLANSQFYIGGEWCEASIFDIADLKAGHCLSGPAIITEPTGTIVIEPGWQGSVNNYGHLILERVDALQNTVQSSTECDPVTLEIFNNLFMSIAEQMGIVLRNTSQSVNVKERLDFSCAIFDAEGNLVANAPHVPVHLGSMDTTVKVIIDSRIPGSSEVWQQRGAKEGRRKIYVPLCHRQRGTGVSKANNLFTRLYASADEDSTRHQETRC